MVYAGVYGSESEGNLIPTTFGRFTQPLLPLEIRRGKMVDANLLVIGRFKFVVVSVSIITV